MKRDLYITVTNEEFYEQILEDAEAHCTNWTINKNARPGDEVALYVMKPYMEIVAVAVVETAPVRCRDIANTWYGSYFADMHSLQMLKFPIHRSKLLARLPRWGYPKQMRTSVKVPDEFAEPMRLMLRLAQGEAVTIYQEA